MFFIVLLTIIYTTQSTHLVYEINELKISKKKFIRLFKLTFEVMLT